MERRTFLATTGAGAGIAVSGVSTAGGTHTTQDSSAEVLTTFTAAGRDIELPPCPVDVMSPSPVASTRVRGEIYSDGTWKSTKVIFPREFEAGNNPGCMGWLTTYSTSLKNLPMTGTFDPGNQLMTASFGIELRTDSFAETYETVLTTGTSGEMEGTFSGIGTGVADVTLVSDDPDSPGHFKLDLQMDVADPNTLSPLVDGEIVEPVVGNTPPQDLDGDGLYENVRGDGEFDIIDVQTLFNNLDTETVQSSSAAFNFSGGDPDRVTVLDVQGLFNRLRRS